jgi:hypothetical protein
VVTATCGVGAATAGAAGMETLAGGVTSTAGAGAVTTGAGAADAAELGGVDNVGVVVGEGAGPAFGVGEIVTEIVGVAVLGVESGADGTETVTPGEASAGEVTTVPVEGATAIGEEVGVDGEA